MIMKKSLWNNPHTCRLTVSDTGDMYSQGRRSYTCGGCGHVFNRICQLHTHLEQHVQGGSYHYDHVTKTAFPKLDRVCAYTQTTDGYFCPGNEEVITLNVNQFCDIEMENIIAEPRRKFVRNYAKGLCATDTGKENFTNYFDMLSGNDVQFTVMNEIFGQKEDTDCNIQNTDKLNCNEELSETSETNQDKKVIDDNDVTKECVDSDTKSRVTIIEVGCKESVKSECDRDISSLSKSVITMVTNKTYKCQECDRGFESKRKLSKHQIIHKNVSNLNSLLFCPVCPKRLTSELLLKTHLSSHSDNKAYSCTLCDKTFTTKQGLKFHIGTHGEKKYKCSECEKKFSYASSLKKHMISHKGSSEFCCDSCGKYFALKSLLEAHVLGHKRIKCFTCEVCGFQTHSRSSLTGHMEVHSDRRFQCTQCDRSYTRKAALAEHMNAHTGLRPYVCEYCAMTFVYQSTLTKHRLIHTGELPYSCEVCSRRFRLQHIYKRHKLTHTMEKPYKCMVCNKAFSQDYNRVIHMRQHTGEKPFSCQNCSKTFAQKCTLKLHMKTHHDRSEVYIHTSQENPLGQH